MIAGATALLSVLLFSCEVNVVEYAACMAGYLEAVLLCVIPCLQHVVRCVSVSQVTAGMRVRLCMHDASPNPNGIIWKWKMEYNSDQHNQTALSKLLLFTAATAAAELLYIKPGTL